MSESPKNDNIKAPNFKETAAAYRRSVISKLVTSKYSGGDVGLMHQGEKKAPMPNIGYTMSDRLSQRAVDAKNQMSLNTDLRHVENVLISSILSPQDQMATNPTYGLDPGIEIGEIGSELLKLVTEYVDPNYKIKNKLSKYLKRSLFIEGAAPVLVLPESSIDILINGLDSEVTQQSFTTLLSHSDVLAPSVGLIDRKDFQQYQDEFGISVTDNFGILKKPALIELYRQRKLTDAYDTQSFKFEGSAKELLSHAMVPTTALGNSANRDDDVGDLIRRSFKRSRKVNQSPVQTVDSVDRAKTKSQGRPLVMDLPTESLIPIYSPNDCTNHVGYFLVLDEETGAPVRHSNQTDFYSDLIKRAKRSASGDSANSGSSVLTSSLIQGAMTQMYGNQGQEISRLTDRQILELYTSKVIEGLENTLKIKDFGVGYTVGKPEEVYQIMLARSMRNRGTKLLYLPAEFVTYIAFDFDDDGVGISLLEQTKLIGALRSLLTMTSMVSEVKNATTNKIMTIGIDEVDPDPLTTASDAVHRYNQTIGMAFPAGINPADALDYIARAGLEVKIEGSNPNLPAMSVNFDDRNSNIQTPNMDFRNSLRDAQVTGCGVPPEMIDASKEIEFATLGETNNLLYAQQCKIRQEHFCCLMTDLIRNILSFDKIFHKQALRIIGEETTKGENEEDLGGLDYVFFFLDHLLFKLPAIEVSRLEVQTKAFTAYSDFLDTVLSKAYVNQEMFGDEDLSGKIGMGLTAYVALVKGKMLREWCHRNDVMPELFGLADYEDTDRMTAEQLFTGFVKGLGTETGTLATLLMKLGAKVTTKFKKPLEALSKAKEGLDGGGMDSDSSGGDDDSFGDSDGDDADDGGSDSTADDGDGGDDGGDEGDQTFGDTEPDEGEDTKDKDTKEDADKADDADEKDTKK